MCTLCIRSHSQHAYSRYKECALRFVVSFLLCACLYLCVCNVYRLLCVHIHKLDHWVLCCVPTLHSQSTVAWLFASLTSSDRNSLLSSPHTQTKKNRKTPQACQQCVFGCPLKSGLIETQSHARPARPAQPGVVCYLCARAGPLSKVRTKLIATSAPYALLPSPATWRQIRSWSLISE